MGAGEEGFDFVAGGFGEVLGLFRLGLVLDRLLQKAGGFVAVGTGGGESFGGGLAGGFGLALVVERGGLGGGGVLGVLVGLVLVVFGLLL